jgi:hypothetical protein
VIRVLDGLQTGSLLSQRLPRDRNWGKTVVPPELEREFNAWKVDVKRYLKPWPDFQKQFSGPMATDGDMFSQPPITQEMKRRLNILTDIVQWLGASERISEP